MNPGGGCAKNELRACNRAGVRMSVAPEDTTGDVWAMWQGHVVEGTFPLRRYLGGSDHSGVFLTERRTGQTTPALALKLVDAVPGLAERQLTNWQTAAGLVHPNLLTLVESGRCQLEERPCLYAVMEYADQTLAQLLTHRALTEEEAREMLLPTLSALAFLHGRKLVHGQVKPANILAVGDRLKLASDTIRPVDERGIRRGAISIYDPPEAREGSYSTAGDIWGLGVSLFEALMRTPPPHPDRRPAGGALPSQFSPLFRELVGRCLSARPGDRPTPAEIEGRLRPQSAAAARHEISRTVAARRPVEPRRAVGASRGLRVAAPLTLAASALLALGWTAMRTLTAPRAVTPAVAQAAREAVPTPGRGEALAERAQNVAPVLTAANTSAAQPQTMPASAEVHAEIPDVPPRAQQTIHGHVRVSVRVIVDKEGTVVAALVDQAGPSRYFEQLAREAAKKWTFPPSDGAAPRLELLRFEFTREGAQGRATSLE